VSGSCANLGLCNNSQADLIRPDGPRRKVPQTSYKLDEQAFERCSIVGRIATEAWVSSVSPLPPPNSQVGTYCPCRPGALLFISLRVWLSRLRSGRYSVPYLVLWSHTLLIKYILVACFPFVSNDNLSCDISATLYSSYRLWLIFSSSFFPETHTKRQAT
jgi:hypothetical protein